MPLALTLLAAGALVVVVRGSVRLTAAAPPPGGPYGPGIGADALANTQVGGPSSGSPNLEVAYRFRAAETAALLSIRIYLADGSGYAGGDGGTLSVSVRADDGSAGHDPSTNALASTSIIPGNPISIGYLPLVTFTRPATLTAGQLYDIVFVNAAASPTIDYVSVNTLWVAVATTPRQPSLPDLDWAELINQGSGWAVRPNYTPILDLGYANGHHQGMGYMEVWIDEPKVISGLAAVRERFTPTVDRQVSAVTVRISRTSGTSPLVLSLIDMADGSTRASVQIRADSFGPDPAWTSAALSSPVVLSAGTLYQLRLTTSADTAYSAFTLERGDRYDFSGATYFTDGHAEYTTSGAAWTGFDQPGGSRDNTNSDLQFYFP